MSAPRVLRIPGRQTPGCDAQLERAVGIGPTYENLADFRRTLRPCSHSAARGSLDLLPGQRFKLGRATRAGTRDRTENAKLGRLAPDQQDTRIGGRRYSRAKARFHDRRSPIQESNLIRSHTRGEHGHRAEGAFVEMLGNAPSRYACKANQQPSASIPVAWAPLLNRFSWLGPAGC